MSAAIVVGGEKLMASRIDPRITEQYPKGENDAVYGGGKKMKSLNSSSNLKLMEVFRSARSRLPFAAFYCCMLRGGGGGE